MTEQPHIGEALLAARLRVMGDKSRKAAAEALECDTSWLFRVERGDFQPSFDFVERAAELYGVSFSGVRQTLAGEAKR